MKKSDAYGLHHDGIYPFDNIKLIKLMQHSMKIF